MAKYVGTGRGGARVKPISRADIVEAQKYTKSNRAAAKFLGVSQPRYKKYASVYNLYDSHSNRKGVGIPKGYSFKPSSVPLKDIFANKHPTYNLLRLKNRLIARGIFVDACAMCGFNEKRVTDGKSPNIITFKNGVRDYALDNLELRCYNCLFLTTGAPSVAHKEYIHKSFVKPETIPKLWQVEQQPSDSLDIHDVQDPTDGFGDIRTEVMKELEQQ
jgi:hypothetical protein